MKYLHYFETQAAHDAVYNGSGYEEPWVSYTEGTGLDYNIPGYRYRHMPLTMEILDVGEANPCKLGTADGESGFILFRDIDLWYNINGGSWIQYGSEYEYFNDPDRYWYQGFEVNTGDIIQWKGDNPAVGQNVFYVGMELNFSCWATQLKIYGNAASIINSTDYASITEYDTGWDSEFWLGDPSTGPNNYNCIFRNMWTWTRDNNGDYIGPDMTNLIYPESHPAIIQ